jgi:hypothetical protein
MMLKQLNCRLCDQNVDSTLDGVFCDWVMGGIGRKDGDYNQLVLISFLLMILLLTGTAFGKGIDCGLVRIGVGFAFLWVLVERHI